MLEASIRYTPRGGGAAIGYGLKAISIPDPAGRISCAGATGRPSVPLGVHFPVCSLQGRQGRRGAEIGLWPVCPTPCPTPPLGSPHTSAQGWTAGTQTLLWDVSPVLSGAWRAAGAAAHQCAEFPRCGLCEGLWAVGRQRARLGLCRASCVVLRENSCDCRRSGALRDCWLVLAEKFAKTVAGKKGIERCILLAGCALTLLWLCHPRPCGGRGRGSLSPLMGLPDLREVALDGPVGHAEGGGDLWYGVPDVE